MNLYPTTTDLRKQGSDASVCGWGPEIEDNQQDKFLENPQYSENLHCMPIQLRGPSYCKRTIKFGRYKSELICGHATLPWQKINFVSTFYLCIQIIL